VARVRGAREIVGSLREGRVRTAVRISPYQDSWKNRRRHDDGIYELHRKEVTDATGGHWAAVREIELELVKVLRRYVMIWRE